jgi:hypothetical protein
VLPIAGALAVGLVLLVLLSLRARARPLGMLAGLGVAVAAGALSWAAGLALLRWSAPFHPEAGSLSAALYHGESWYMLSLVASVLLVITGLSTLLARWLRPVEMLVGALVCRAGSRSGRASPPHSVR